MIPTPTPYVPAAEAACDVPRMTPWGMGFDAYCEGRPLSDCPYDHQTETLDCGEWQAGWWDAYNDTHP